MRRERLANITTTAAVEDMIARYLQGETTDTLDTIRSLARQRDALRAIVAQNVVDCCVCKGTGKIESREDFGACPWCAPRRAALEVR